MPKRQRAHVAPFPIPAVLTIRGKRWLILREHNLGHGDYDVAVRRDLKKARGETDMNIHEIHLGRGQSPRGEASTLLHELLHACSRGRIPLKHEEKFIADIEPALLDVLEQLAWRNPERKPLLHAESDAASENDE